MLKSTKRALSEMMKERKHAVVEQWPEPLVVQAGLIRPPDLLVAATGEHLGEMAGKRRLIRDDPQQVRTNFLGYSAHYWRETRDFLLAHPRTVFSVVASTQQRDDLVYAMNFGKTDPRVILTANSASAFETLGHKGRFPEIMRRAGAERFLPETEVYEKDSVPKFADAVRKFGPKFLVQKDGAGGEGTTLVESEDRYNAALTKVEKSEKLRLTKFYEGVTSSNLTAVCLPGQGVYTYWPTRKGVGLTIAENRFGTSGAKYNYPWPKEVVEQMRGCAEMVGRYLQTWFNYRGVVGFDFIVKPDGRVYATEVNLRFQGGIGMIDWLAFEAGVTPPTALHLLSFPTAVSEDFLGWLPKPDEFLETLRGQLPVEPLGGIKIFSPDLGKLRVGATARANALWQWDDGRFHSPDYGCLVGGRKGVQIRFFPEPGWIIEPVKIIGRVEVSGPEIWDLEKPNALNRTGQEIVDAAVRLLQLTPVG